MTPRRLGFGLARLGDGDGVIGKVGEPQIVAQQTAIGVRVGAHPPLARRRQFANVPPQRAVESEQFLRPVAAHPLFEELDVLGLLHVAERHLMRTPVAFGLQPVDGLGAGPAFGAAQHDHRPARSGDDGAAAAGRALDRGDLVEDHVEGRRHQLVHRGGIVALDEMRLVAVADETGSPAGRAGCGRGSSGWRSCSRSGAGSAAPRRRAPGSGICCCARRWRAARSRPRRRRRRRRRSGRGCRRRRHRRARQHSRVRRLHGSSPASRARHGSGCRPES